MNFSAKLHERTPRKHRGLISVVESKDDQHILNFQTSFGFVPTNLSFASENEAHVAGDLIREVLQDRWPTCRNGCHVPYMIRSRIYTENHLDWSYWAVSVSDENVYRTEFWKAPFGRCHGDLLSRLGIHPPPYSVIPIERPTGSQFRREQRIRPSTPFSIRFRSTPYCQRKWEIETCLDDGELVRSVAIRLSTMPDCSAWVAVLGRETDEMSEEEILTILDQRTPWMLPCCPEGCHAYVPAGMINDLFGDSRRWPNFYFTFRWIGVGPCYPSYCQATNMLFCENGDILQCNLKQTLRLPDLSPVNEALEKMRKI